MLSPADGARLWAQRLAGSTSRIQAGVQGVTQSPSQKAIAQQSVLLQNFTNAVTSGKWATNLGRVQLGDWQQAMITKGLPRIQSGAAAGQSKMEQVNARLYPYIESGRQSLPPRGDLSANTQRAVQWIEYMSRFRRGG